MKNRLVAFIATLLLGFMPPAWAQTFTFGTNPTAIIYASVKLRNLAPALSGAGGAEEIQIFSGAGETNKVGALHVGYVGTFDLIQIKYNRQNLRVFKLNPGGAVTTVPLPASGPPINYVEFQLTKNTPSMVVRTTHNLFKLLDPTPDPEASSHTFLSNFVAGVVTGGANTASYSASNIDAPNGVFEEIGLETVGLMGGGDTNSVIVRFGYVPPPDAQAPVVSSVATQPVPALLNGQVTVNANVSDETTGNNSIASAQYSLNGGAWQVMSAQDGAFNSPNEDVTGSFYATTLGQNQVCVKGTDSAGNTSTPMCQTFTVTYKFTGFQSPVDNDPAVNVLKAGQAVPAKWRITDANDVPISDPTSFKNLLSYAVSCNDFAGDPDDSIEEVASGGSGLQYNGDGYWQFNWKTASNYANTCRAMMVEFQHGVTSPVVKFKFKK